MRIARSAATCSRRWVRGRHTPTSTESGSRARPGPGCTGCWARSRSRQQQRRLRPLPRGPFELQAGRFALPFGGYSARHLSEADPFIRPPLPYDYRTVVAPTVAPAALAGFLTWQNDPALRGRGRRCGRVGGRG